MSIIRDIKSLWCKHKWDIAGFKDSCEKHYRIFQYDDIGLSLKCSHCSATRWFNLRAEIKKLFPRGYEIISPIDNVENSIRKIINDAHRRLANEQN